MRLIKTNRHKSKKIMQSARGQDCTLRLANPCSSTETTVGCHIGFNGSGIGTKDSDLFIAYGCSNCHDIIDGKVKRPMGLSRNMMDWCKARAMQETQQKLLDIGLITI